MIYNDKKTSLLVTQQLPEFIRDNPDYANFSLFIKAYYEWLETANAANSHIGVATSSNQGVTYSTKNLLKYKDIDSTLDDFISYFKNEFLPYFPKDTLINERQALKVARQLYQSKGTPSSYKFLFRILYNSDFEVFYTKDAVFKPSDGVWYVAKSLKLATQDSIFRTDTIKQYRLFGETSQSIATIENAVLAGNKTEVFISNIERLFQSGEYVRVIDSNNQDVLHNGNPIRAKVVGQISAINIDANHRGLTYKVGDPVVVYGGLNSETGHGATAYVSETTKGSVKSIRVVKGGYGYTPDPQTLINVIGDGKGVTSVVSDLDANPHTHQLVSFVASESLGLAWNTKVNATNYNFLTNHVTANVNTKLSDALKFTSFDSYPIGSVIVSDGGSGFTGIPEAQAKSLYFTEYSDQPTAYLSNLGILAPIQIVNPGLGYVANDKIVITGGSGYGAYANVITVAANGAITNVAYVYDQTNIYPLGGMGYRQSDKNIVATVNSANNQANGAQLLVPGILGEGAEFKVEVDRAGSITTIKLTDPGEDYVSTPNVSLKVQDIVVSNVSVSNPPKKGDQLYQGTDAANAVYQATVDSVTLLKAYNEPTNSLYRLRVFEYNSNPNPAHNLVIDKTVGQINMIMANNKFDGTFDQYGIKNYGDGSAKATAKFLNGLVISQGQYLNQQGQPSSFSVLQDQSYNNYTYEITVSKEIEKYRSVLLNLLHPAGTHVKGRMTDSTKLPYDSSMVNALYSGRPLYATIGGIGQIGATATMSGDFDHPSTNIIQFNNIPPSVNLAQVILPGTFVQLQGGNGMNVHSRAVTVDPQTNRVTVRANTWVTIANVATILGQTGSNTINITGLTGSYDLVNGGRYSNTSYPLIDIISVGDRIKVANNTVKTVASVDYTTGNGVIYLTTNLTSDANSTLSVSRTILANSNYTSNQIKLYGAIGATYIPELATENGQILTTEDGRIILLG